MKKALFLYYSQTGQTERAMNTLAEGFRELSGAQVDIATYTVAEKFAFPWKITGFFRAFPRSVLGLAPRMNPLTVNLADYDLIFLGGQVWFLSPSIPLHSFLQADEAKALAGKRVITVLTCRNLWYSALKVLRAGINALGGQFLGQITVCEISPLWASFVTTPRWMLTGKKGAFAFFPPAGIREQDFAALSQLGRNLGQSFAQSGGEGVNQELLTSNLDRIALRMMDRIGRRVFTPWARTIVRIAPNPGWWQDFWLIIFRINLIFLIVLVAPYTRVVEVLLGRWNSTALATLKD